MGVRVAVFAGALCLAVWSGGAVAQEAPAGPPVAAAPAAGPTAETTDLARQFVGVQDIDEMVAEVRSSMVQSITEKLPNLPRQQMEWFKQAAGDAGEVTTREMLADMEAKLVEAYAANFSAGELREVLAFQVFVKQPKIMAAVQAAEAAPDTERFRLLADRLTDDELQQLGKMALSRPMLRVMSVTMDVAKEVTPRFVARFMEELRARCGPAQSGMPLCKPATTPT